MCGGDYVSIYSCISAGQGLQKDVLEPVNLLLILKLPLCSHKTKKSVKLEMTLDLTFSL